MLPFIVGLLFFPCVSFAAEDFEAWAHKLNAESSKVVQRYAPHVNAKLKNSKCCSAKSIPVLSLKQDEKRYPELLIFVSFSMSLKTLESLADAAQKVGGKLVFRGLVEGDFQKTIQKFQKLKREALIDPTLFRHHQVSHVPVFIQGKNRIAGNISVPYALEQFELKGERS